MGFPPQALERQPGYREVSRAPACAAGQPTTQRALVYYSREAIFKGAEVVVKIKVKNVNHSQARSPYASKASCFWRHHLPVSPLQVLISSARE